MINEIAKTTIKQIGNKAFFMMGAKNMNYSDDGSINFNIKGSRKFNHIKIELDRGMDLYNMTFYKLGKFDIKSEKTMTGLYADMLHGTIEKETGLYLSL